MWFFPQHKIPYIWARSNNEQRPATPPEIPDPGPTRFLPQKPVEIPPEQQLNYSIAKFSALDEFSGLDELFI